MHHYNAYYFSGQFVKKKTATHCREPGCGQPRWSGTAMVLCKVHFAAWKGAREARYRAVKRASDRRYRRENIARIKAYEKAYYQQNRERKIAQAKAQYERDPEAVKARARKREREHPSIKRDKRARQRGAFQESVDRQVVFDRDDGICQMCFLPVDPDDWHLDHIVPLGPGPHCYENVRVAHPKCNGSKIGEDKRVLAEWRAA